MKPTSLEGTVRAALRSEGLPARNDLVIVGLSGGADSVALVDVMASMAARTGFTVVAAHLDHGLRPESADDAAFCAELCARLGVDFRGARADVRARALRDGKGLEDAARTERQQFLRQVAAETQAAAIVLAHTQDDQAETVLLRLLRGAGSLGLSAMRLRNGALLRPMLRCSRADVMEHLAARGLTWREDASNLDLDFMRNRVRHELLPYLTERFNPQVRVALAQTADILAAEGDALAAAAAVLYGRAARMQAGTVAVRCDLLGAAPQAVARAAVRLGVADAGGSADVSLRHVDGVLALARSGASGRRRPLPGRREARIHFGELQIGPAAPDAAPVAYTLRLAVPGSAELPDGRSVTASPVDGSGAVEAAEPLVVRTRRPGDRFVARDGEISLKKHLIERRVPAALRSRMPLVAEGNRVLWIAGEPAHVGHGARVVRLELVEDRPRSATLGTSR